MELADQTPDNLVAAPPREQGRLKRRVYAWRRRSVIRQVDHPTVLLRVHAEGGWSSRFAFMVTMSAGIAILGLLLSSPAVVIGAMLISPLMGPIIGLGFALATFDWQEVRKSLIGLGIGTLLAVGFSAAVVVLSPLQDITPEILARTRPNLFDLLVAVFSALAGGYATVRGRGETIVGVAIATALMPPLAVVGFGLATSNMAIFLGSVALYVTNAVAIALSATLVARYYGFGSELSPRQSRQQAIALVLVFTALAVPLALSLRQIAWEAWATRTARSALQDEFGDESRIASFDPGFTEATVKIRTTVFTPTYRDKAAPDLGRRLSAKLGRPTEVDLSQIVVNQGDLRAELERARSISTPASKERLVRADLAAQVALALGVPVEQVLVDPVTRVVSARIPAGMALPDAMAAESRLHAASPGWRFAFQPGAGPFPDLPVPDEDELTGLPDKAPLDAWAWAIQRAGTNRVSLQPRRLLGETSAQASARAERAAKSLAEHGIEAELLPALPADRALELDRGRTNVRAVRVELLPYQSPPPPVTESQEPVPAASA